MDDTHDTPATSTAPNIPVQVARESKSVNRTDQDESSITKLLDTQRIGPGDDDSSDDFEPQDKENKSSQFITPAKVRTKKTKAKEKTPSPAVVPVVEKPTYVIPAIRKYINLESKEVKKQKREKKAIEREIQLDRWFVSVDPLVDNAVTNAVS